MLHQLLVLMSAITSLSFAAPKLDRPYRNLRHPMQDLQVLSQRQQPPLPVKSDFSWMLTRVTSVKNQDGRGTCSIFSAAALLESMMILSGRSSPNVDLSEEWLQYLTTLEISEEGSDSPANFKLLRQYGIPNEAQMPYVGTAWVSKRSGLASRRCGYLPRGKQLRACLISHRDPALMAKSDPELLTPASVFYDPEFVAARASAFLNRDNLFEPETSPTDDGIVTSVTEIHQLLAQGIPMTMEFDFYYGSWSHPEAKKLGINRSPRLWRQGAVTYPEPGSTDLAFSKKSPAGHSVLVVGYDDDRKITYWVRMKNGQRKKITRKGVYYFKNSWGLPAEKSWGSEFTIHGVHYPGYGMILQDHAHDFGQFFRLQLR